MKTEDDIQADLDTLVQGHYYSEDYELEWAAYHYYEDLRPEEREPFEGAMVRRLSGHPGMADISLCARLGMPVLTPLLAGLLDREERSSSTSRALLTALSHQPDEQAYVSVERFMESEQEGEALLCLARMNFQRTLPHLRWAVQKEDLHNFCIHALHEYKQKAGMGKLSDAIRELVEPDRDVLAPHLQKILTSKSGRFNPFDADELERLMALLS